MLTGETRLLILSLAQLLCIALPQFLQSKLSMATVTANPFNDAASHPGTNTGMVNMRWLPTVSQALHQMAWQVISLDYSESSVMSVSKPSAPFNR